MAGDGANRRRIRTSGRTESGESHVVLDRLRRGFPRRTLVVAWVDVLVDVVGGRAWIEAAVEPFPVRRRRSGVSLFVRAPTLCVEGPVREKEKGGPLLPQ